MQTEHFVKKKLSYLRTSFRIAVPGVKFEEKWFSACLPAMYRLPGLVELLLEDSCLTLGGLREIVANKMFWRQHNCQVQ